MTLKDVAPRIKVRGLTAHGSSPAKGKWKFARARCVVKHKAGTFQDFKDYTVAVARGERRVDPREPKIWCEPVEAGEDRDRAVHFASLEAGAKLPPDLVFCAG